MQDIVFKATFGDERKQVELRQPNGIGGEIWFISINGYHKGQMWKLDDRWVCYDTQLTYEDIQILGRIIQKGSL